MNRREGEVTRDVSVLGESVLDHTDVDTVGFEGALVDELAVRVVDDASGYSDTLLSGRTLLVGADVGYGPILCPGSPKVVTQLCVVENSRFFGGRDLDFGGALFDLFGGRARRISEDLRQFL